MDIKAELKKVVESLEKKGVSRIEMGAKLEHGPRYITQELSKGTNSRLLKQLKKMDKESLKATETDQQVKHMISMPAVEYIRKLERDKELLGEMIMTNLNGLHSSQNTLTAMISGGLNELAKLSSRVLDQPFEDVANRISKVNDAAASSLKKEGKGADSQHKSK